MVDALSTRRFPIEFHHGFFDGFDRLAGLQAIPFVAFGLKFSTSASNRSPLAFSSRWAAMAISSSG
jgi:hypothetical protein